MTTIPREPRAIRLRRPGQMVAVRPDPADNPDNFYQIETYCSNCDAEELEVDVPKATPWPRGETIEDVVCPECGCATLVRYELEDEEEEEESAAATARELDTLELRRLMLEEQDRRRISHPVAPVVPAMPSLPGAYPPPYEWQFARPRENERSFHMVTPGAQSGRTANLQSLSTNQGMLPNANGDVLPTESFAQSTALNQQAMVCAQDYRNVTSALSSSPADPPHYGL